MGKKVVFGALGILLGAVGVIWTLQGLGYLKGSSMTGQSFWAIVGPVVAGLGVALLYVALRGRASRR